MTGPEVADRVRGLWAGLAGVPVRFPAAGEARVLQSPRSQLCPPGWVGLVAVEGAVLGTAPTAAAVAVVAGALRGRVDDLDGVVAALRPGEVRGPAALAYLWPADFRPRSTGGVEYVDTTEAHALLAEADAEESGLAEVTSRVAVLRDGVLVLAAAGWHLWPGRTAQLSVLTAAGHRGRGLAGQVASAAVADALAAGLLPQWRARPAASLRVAERLGFRVLGQQVSLRLPGTSG